MSILSQSALIAAIITFALTVRMLIQERRTWLFYAFAVLSGLLTIWNAAQFMSDLTSWHGWDRIGTVAALFIPVSALTLFQLFLDEQEPRRDPLWRAMAVGAVALTPFVIGLWSRPWVRTVVFICVFLGLYLCVVPFWKRQSTMQSSSDEARLKYLVGGGLLSITFAFLDFVPRLDLWWEGLNNAPALGNVILVIFMFFLSEMIIQYRLMSLSELFGKLMVLVPMAFVLAIVYVLLSLLSGETSPWFLVNTTIVMAFVLVILYEPMKVQVEERINRFLFRERYEFAHQLALLRREIANVVELDELTNLVMQRLENSLRVTQASLYLLEDDALGVRRVGSIGEAPDRLDAVTERVFLERARERRFLVLRDLEDDLDEERKSNSGEQANIERMEQLIQTIKSLRAAVVIAIVSNDRLVGLLNVNDERLRDPYAPEEIRSLVQIASQAAISIENSQAVASLREKDRLAAIGEMAAGLAHEIRNPLGAIKGAVQFLSISGSFTPDDGFDDEDDESPEAFLDIIIEETNRLNKVVSQFLDYARPYRGDPEQCDISRLVERVEPLFRTQAEAWGVAVEMNLVGSLPEASADPEQLKQVILNLALNAIQATGAQPLEPDSPHADEPLEQRRGSGPRAPALTFTTGLTRRVHNTGGRLFARDMIEIEITDNGKGIPAEDQANIFIPFFTTKQKGTGLGLAISQRIIENLGGRIELDSQVGQGTTFRVLLPVWDSAARSLSDLPSPLPAAPGPPSPQATDAA